MCVCGALCTEVFDSATRHVVIVWAIKLWENFTYRGKVAPASLSAHNGPIKTCHAARRTPYT